MMGADLRGPRVFYFGLSKTQVPTMENFEKARADFRSGKSKGLQRGKNRRASEPRVANFSLQAGLCTGETQQPVLVMYGFYEGCEYAPATSETRSLKEVV